MCDARGCKVSLDSLFLLIARGCLGLAAWCGRGSRGVRPARGGAGARCPPPPSRLSRAVAPSSPRSVSEENTNTNHHPSNATPPLPPPFSCCPPSPQRGALALSDRSALSPSGAGCSNCLRRAPLVRRSSAVHRFCPPPAPCCSDSRALWCAPAGRWGRGEGARAREGRGVRAPIEGEGSDGRRAWQPASRHNSNGTHTLLRTAHS